MAVPRGRGLRDNEIEFALSDSELDIGDDEEADILYETAETNNIERYSHESSSSDDENVPLSELVSRPTRGRPRLRRGESGGRRRNASRGRRCRSAAVRFVQENRNDSSPERAREWLDTDFIPSDIPFTQPAYKEQDSAQFIEKYDYFKQYFDDELVQLIVLKSNQTFVKLTGKTLGLTDSEFYIYLGISLVMSAIQYPQLRMYWAKQFRVPLIADNMSRNRFFLLRNSIKFVYDDEIGRDVRDADRLWKVRPLLDKVLQGCKMQSKEESLSIDEMIVPFAGNCGFKQYVPSKPNPTGLKVFVLANPNGIVCNFDVYQGTTTYPDYENTNFGLGEKAVLHLAEDLAPGHRLYFDRYFTTLRLAEELKRRNLLCAGTIMRNRIPISARAFLKEDRELKQEGRGSCQMLVNSQNIAITKWLDNKSVTLLSSAHGVEPTDRCRRWSKSQKQFIDVSRPCVVKNYNSSMGGVDLADRMISVCPNRYRTKKWTLRTFSHMIDLSCSNAWILFKQNQLAENVPVKKIQQLRSFKLELGESLLDAYAGTSNAESDEEDGHEEAAYPRRGRPPTVRTPSEKSRKKGAIHMPEITDVQKKCRNCHKMKTTVKCTNCDMNLCLRKDRNCFLDFHT